MSEGPTPTATNLTQNIPPNTNTPSSTSSDKRKPEEQDGRHNKKQMTTDETNIWLKEYLNRKPKTTKARSGLLLPKFVQFNYRYVGGISDQHFKALEAENKGLFISKIRGNDSLGNTIKDAIHFIMEKFNVSDFAIEYCARTGTKSDPIFYITVKSDESHIKIQKIEGADQKKYTTYDINTFYRLLYTIQANNTSYDEIVEELKKKIKGNEGITINNGYLSIYFNNWENLMAQRNNSTFKVKTATLALETYAIMTNHKLISVYIFKNMQKSLVSTLLHDHAIDHMGIFQHNNIMHVYVTSLGVQAIDHIFVKFLEGPGKQFKDNFSKYNRPQSKNTNQNSEFDYYNKLEELYDNQSSQH